MEKAEDLLLVITKLIYTTAKDFDLGTDGTVSEGNLLRELKESIQCEQRWISERSARTASIWVPTITRGSNNYSTQISYATKIAEKLALLETGNTWEDLHKKGQDHFMEIPHIMFGDIETLEKMTEERPGIILRTKRYFRKRTLYNGDFIDFPYLPTNIQGVFASVDFTDRRQNHPGNFQRGFSNKFRAAEFIPDIRLSLNPEYFIKTTVETLL